MMRTCLNCHEELNGRSDKKFCSVYCKSAYHYAKNKEKDASLFMQVDKQLKKNRQLLKSYNKAGKSIVRKSELLKAGFNPRYFTSYWKNRGGDVYLFCYEYGFLEKQEPHAVKYVLVTWQPYMDS